MTKISTKKKEPLAIVLNHFGTASETFLMQLIEGLKEFFEIKIYVRLTINKASPWYEKFEVIHLPRKNSIPFLLYALKTPFVFKNQKSIREHYIKFRLNFMDGEKVYYPFLAMVSELAQYSHLFKQKKIYTSIRGTDITVTPYLKPACMNDYKKIQKDIYAIHYLSKDLEELTNSYKLQFPKPQVIHQGVNLDKWIRNKKLNKDKLRLITVGRLHYIKGLEFALVMAKEILDSQIDFELKIIGDGPDRDKLEFLCKSLGLSKHVHFLGKLHHDEMLAHYEESNVYIHTHLVNGLSNTMLEALAMDLKVVTFDSNMVSYQLPQLAEGIIEIPRYDIKKFGSVLTDLFKRGELGISQELKNLIQSEFSLEKHVLGFKDFFENDQ